MENKPVVLICGLEDSAEIIVRRLTKDAEIQNIASSDEFIEKLEGLKPENIHIACCGPAIEDLQPAEIAQSLKVQLRGRPLYFLSTAKYSADDRDLFKNGFDSSFFLPLDLDLLEKTFKVFLSELTGVKEESYVSVPLDEIQVASKIDFDIMIFLPLNRKYLRIMNKGDVVSSEAMEKLKTQNFNSIFIKQAEEALLRTYIKAKKVEGTSTQSSFERKELMHSNVRELFHSFLAPAGSNFDDGRNILVKAQELVGQLVAKDSIASVLDDLFKQTGQFSGDHYDQALRVSTYVSMFAVFLKECKPEDLAIAGLFYHLGLARCPSDILKRSEAQMTNEEKKIYYKHPEDSVALAQEKKVILMQEVTTAILQHHERLDGTGYPKQLRSPKIKIEATILGLASEFDELTSLKEGREKLTADQAVKKLSEAQTGEADVMRKIHRAITSSSKQAA